MVASSSTDTHPLSPRPWPWQQPCSGAGCSSWAVPGTWSHLGHRESECSPRHGLTNPRDKVAVMNSPGLSLSENPLRYFAGKVTPGGLLGPQVGLAARCHSAARAPLSGPSVLTSTTVSHRHSFAPAYLSFGCRQNETARVGRLAAQPIKVETALPCQRVSPGPAGLALLVLCVRARAAAGLKVVVEIPSVRPWKVSVEVNVKIIFKKKSWKARNVGQSLVSPEKNATALLAISATMSTISKCKDCVCFNLTY